VSGMTIIGYTQNQKIEKSNNSKLKVFGGIKPKGLNRIAKIS
jgi:hypothetical protein